MNKQKLILSILFSLVVSRFIFINPTTHIIGEGKDSFEFFGFMHIVAHNISTKLYPFSDTNVLRYPDGFSFSYGYDGGFAVLTGGVLGLFLPQVLAYNVTILLILIMNLYLSWIAFSKIGHLYNKTNIDYRAFVAALIFGYSPFVLARINSHLNLAFVAGLPLLLYSIALIINRYDNNRSLDRQEYLTVFFSLLLISLGSLQYLVILSYVFIALIGITYLIPIYRGYRGVISFFLNDISRKAADGIFVFFMVFLFFYWGYIKAFLSGELETGTILNNIAEDPTLLDLFVPNSYLGSYYEIFNGSTYSIEKVATIGLIGILLLLICLISIRKQRQLFRLSISLFLFYIFFATGSLSLPLYPEGGRFVVFISLLLGLLVMLVDFLKSRKLTMFIIIVLLLERALLTVQTTEVPDFSFISEIRSDIGASVLNIPTTKFNSMESALPYFYDTNVFGGYFHHTALNKEAEKNINETGLLGKFNCENDLRFYSPSPLEFSRTVAFLRDNDTSHIVLYKSGYSSKFLHDECKNVRSSWYWFNSPKLELSESNPEVRAHTFELPLHQDFVKADLYMGKSGMFKLVGLFITPPELNSIKVTLPDGSEIYPQFNRVRDGNSIEFDPAIEIEVTAGDFVTISSDANINDNKYISVFYVYEPWVESDPIKPHLFEKVFEDENVEVYKINYE